MSKVFIFFIILLIESRLGATTTFALDNCSGLTTDPSNILSNTSKVKFTINVGNNKAFSKWRIKFVCGLNSDEVDANLEGSDSISAERTNSVFHPCEFSLDNPHQISVKAVVNNTPIDQCTANYIVKETAKQCSLTIDPKEGITSATTLSISGSNLASGSKYKIFFDDKGIDVLGGFVDEGSFTGQQVPQSLVIPGFHHIDIRILKGLSSLPIIGINPFDIVNFGPPLCSAFFTVGTADNPGSFITSGAPTANKGPFAVGGGKSCDNENNPDHPSIKTAIGCIHTNPIDLIKDLLKFSTGISGGLAFLMMLLGAFQMITSAGNPETLQAGRDRFQSAIIGLLFVIFAVLLLKIIGVDILGLGEQFGFKP